MKTTSYKISKKLAEIGFKAETEKAFDNKGTLISCHRKICILREKSSNPEIYGLPTYDLETILEALPKQIERGEKRSPASSFIFTKAGMGYAQKPQIEFREFVVCHENESLADTGARLLILLYEKSLVNFN